MSATSKLIENIKRVEHGFKQVEVAGEIFLADQSVDHLAQAINFLHDESCQVRMLATYMLGHLAARDNKSLQILTKKVAADENWRVQEMLAKALDTYCKAKCYEAALPVIKKWLADKNPNLRRAVVEGLRIWTGRPFFKENPGMAIQLIAQLRHKADESEYLVRSIGNALHDIRKKHAKLVDAEVSSWDRTDKTIQSIVKLIGKETKMV